MTDDLIARLRLSQTGGIHYEAADALEAQDARIAELEQMVAVLMRHEARDDTIKVQRDRIAKLEAALKELDGAFAWLLLDCVDEDYIKNNPAEYKECIDAARAAADALKETDDPRLKWHKVGEA